MLVTASIREHAFMGKDRDLRMWSSRAGLAKQCNLRITTVHACLRLRIVQ
jgi:hypothetical protein